MDIRNCSVCGTRTKVGKTVPEADGRIRRYRYCPECGASFPTVENLAGVTVVSGQAKSTENSTGT